MPDQPQQQPQDPVASIDQDFDSFVRAQIATNRMNKESNARVEELLASGNELLERLLDRIEALEQRVGDLEGGERS